MTLTEQKQAQRQAGVAARKALSAQVRSAADAAICAGICQTEAYRRAGTLLVYAAWGGEVDLSALIQTAQQDGKTVAWPVCGEGYRLTAVVPGPAGWQAGRYGIQAPVLDGAQILRPDQLDLVVTPCTAFDPDCGRVGMGKGYYDRFLPLCTHAFRLGAAYEVQKVEQASADPNDQRLDAVITEGRVYRCKI